MTRRIWTAVGTLAILVVVDFALPRALPADPIAAMLTDGSPSFVDDAEARDHLLERYGLNDPVWVQLGEHLQSLSRGDLGMSIQHNTPVTGLLATRLPRSVVLLATAFVLGTTAGIAAGLRAGWRGDSAASSLAMVVAAGLRSVPVFLLGSVAVVVFAVKLGWFPIAGHAPRFASGGSTLVQRLHHLVLPALVLATPFATAQLLVMRAATFAQVGASHVTAGRAGGLTNSRLRSRYAGRNALLPVVELMALQLSSASTGLIMVETVFRYDGIGLLIVDAVRARDYPVIQGTALVLGVLVVAATMATDLLRGRIDPRVVLQ